MSEDSGEPGSWMADARTGRILWQTAGGSDNGRGVAADVYVYAGSPGAEAWSASDTTLRSATGASLIGGDMPTPPRPAVHTP
ncbi:hypothetical protein [Streptomyces hilarionis]|uniref:rhamnogalacturonan lyase family protein n=1 Tax=Streptomyces hilarionis TaxID=2839954 RepID=UPI003F6861BB